MKKTNNMAAVQYVPRSFTIYPPSELRRPKGTTGQQSSIGILLKPEHILNGLCCETMGIIWRNSLLSIGFCSIVQNVYNQLWRGIKWSSLRLSQSRSYTASFHVARAEGIDARVEAVNKKCSSLFQAGHSTSCEFHYLIQVQTALWRQYDLVDTLETQYDV